MQRQTVLTAYFSSKQLLLFCLCIPADTLRLQLIYHYSVETSIIHSIHYGHFTHQVHLVFSIVIYEQEHFI